MMVLQTSEETGPDWGRTTKDQESLSPSEGTKYLWTWNGVRKERKRQMKRLGELHWMKRHE